MLNFDEDFKPPTYRSLPRGVHGDHSALIVCLSRQSDNNTGFMESAMMTVCGLFESTR